MKLKDVGVPGVFGLLALVVGLGQATTYGAGPPATPLVEAAKRADAAAVHALLQAGADVNAQEVDGTTVLHWAVYHDDPELVDVLVRAGAKASASNRYGVTPLWVATINGNTAIVERLLEAGADARAARADNGETTLMIAARAGHTDVMQVLLDHGANVNAVESHRGQTALMWAAAEKHPAAVKLLLEAGADAKARSGTDPAAHEGHRHDMVRAELTPLMFAIRAGDIETTRVLLDVGDLTETASDGTSLLMLAILNANFELANFLLERGADPNVDDPHGGPLFVLTWLRSAVNRSLTSILVRTPSGNMDTFDLGRALLAHGADIDARIEGKDPEPPEGEEETPQSRRLRRWRPSDLAIGPYYLSFAGATPFYIAAINCDVPYMKFLVDNGADATIPTRQNITPLLAASGIGFYEGEHPGDPTVCLEAVKLTYELGNDPLAVVEYGEYLVGSPSWDGATAMHGAATRGANEMVEWLLEKGVPLETKTKEGMSAWDIADGSNITNVFHRWEETATLLRRLMEERGIPIEVSPARGLRTY